MSIEEMFEAIRNGAMTQEQFEQWVYDRENDARNQQSCYDSMSYLGVVI